MNLIILLFLLAVNLGLWYFSWEQCLKTPKEWLKILILVFAYVITMDMLLQELGKMELFILVKVFLFLLYLIVLMPVFRKKDPAV